MKHKILLLCLLACIIQKGYAQKKTREVIYLKNGSVIRGIQELHHLDSLIEVRTGEGSLIRFEVAALDHITREAIAPEVRSHGYFVGIELGLYTGRSYQDIWSNSTRENSPNLQVVTGYHWNSHWSSGIGTGFDFYNYRTLIPVFARGMYMPLTTRLTPVIVMDAGYGFYPRGFNGSVPNNQSIKGGLLLNPAAGFMVRSQKHTAFLFTLGYRQQNMVQSVQNGEINNTQEISMRRFSIRMSLLF